MPNLESWRHYLRGRLYQLVKRPERALSEYRATLEHDPDFAHAAHLLAFLLFERRQYVEAERYFQETLRLRPKNAQAWFNLGFLYDHTGQPPRAVEAFQQAVRFDPKLDSAWYGLGLALATLDRHDEAARALEAATRLQPMNGRAWYMLGMAYHMLRQDLKVKEVVQHLNRFDRHTTRRLILDTGRSDLAHLIADLQA